MSSLADSISSHNQTVPTKAVPLAVIDNTAQTVEFGSKGSRISSEDYRKAVEDATGYPVPEGLDVVLERMTLQERPDGAAQWWYKFKFVPATVDLTDIERPGLKDLVGWVRSQPRKTPSSEPRKGGTAVLCIADLQLGKTGSRGTTKETVAAFYDGVEQMKDYIRQHGCSKAVLAELGDGIENFQNVKSQAQTNDHSLIEQLNLHGDLLTYATAQIAKEVDELLVVGVPSNHMEVREDGEAVGGPANDYGLLSLAGVKRVCEYNPAAFGHVKFAWPGEYDVSLTLDVNGVPVGFAHGHYARGAAAANAVEKWLDGQFAGNQPLQPAHIIVTGHFHHLRVQNVTGGRWWLQCPTVDRGSDWLRFATGQGDSQNGFLAFRIEDGASSWSDKKLLRTR